MNNNNLDNMTDEKIDELIQHYPPGGPTAETPYKIALAEKHRRLKEKAAAEQAWKNEITRQIAELKKPHWTVNPNFWFTSIAAISGIIGCILTWHSAQQPKNPPISGVQQPALNVLQLTQKKTEFQQNILKPVSSSRGPRKPGHRD